MSLLQQMSLRRRRRLLFFWLKKSEKKIFNTMLINTQMTPHKLKAQLLIGWIKRRNTLIIYRLAPLTYTLVKYLTKPTTSALYVKRAQFKHCLLVGVFFRFFFYERNFFDMEFYSNSIWLRKLRTTFAQERAVN